MQCRLDFFLPLLSMLNMAAIHIYLPTVIIQSEETIGLED